MRTIAAVLLAMTIPVISRAEPMQDRFVWLFGIDWTRTPEMARVEEILTGASAHGINGVIASGGAAQLAGLKEVCDRLALELIPAQFSFGYGGPWLGHDRNLAEGFPVVDAPFVAGADGKATLVPDPAVAIRNGDFEDHDGNRFSGLGFHDAPGEVSFADTAIRHGGAASIRLTDFTKDKWGHGRVNEAVKVTPNRCYKVTIWAKSQDLSVDEFKIMTLLPGDAEEALSHRSFRLPATADWTKVEYVFNSGSHTDVLLYAGVWGGRSGTLWLDDWTITELGPMNPLRRPGCPVSVKGEDGKAYVEGRDYARIEDPGLHPWTIRNDMPITLLPGSRIKPGAKLKASWYHPMIVHEDQVGVCMAEPGIYSIAEAEAKALAAKIRPKRLLLNMDEIREGGTCAACRGRNMAELLGQSVTRIARIVAKAVPGIQVYCWSDMFDPNHNAHGHYYHVVGDYTGSWKHIPKSVVMAVWGSDVNEKSFEFFSKEGFQVLGACYYDADNLDQVKPWIAMARKHPNVRGLMYTTWVPRYDLLPAFADLIRAK